MTSVISPERRAVVGECLPSGCLPAAAPGSASWRATGGKRPLSSIHDARWKSTLGRARLKKSEIRCRSGGRRVLRERERGDHGFVNDPTRKGGPCAEAAPGSPSSVRARTDSVGGARRSAPSRSRTGHRHRITGSTAERVLIVLQAMTRIDGSESVRESGGTGPIREHGRRRRLSSARARRSGAGLSGSPCSARDRRSPSRPRRTSRAPRRSERRAGTHARRVFAHSRAQPRRT